MKLLAFIASLCVASAISTLKGHVSKNVTSKAKLNLSPIKTSSYCDEWRNLKFLELNHVTLPLNKNITHSTTSNATNSTTSKLNGDKDTFDYRLCSKPFKPAKNVTLSDTCTVNKGNTTNTAYKLTGNACDYNFAEPKF